MQVATTLRDPVHGSIRLADWVVPIIDHPEFQRLRRVRQLGTAHMVYPGANHSRFEHSLGAYHLANRLAQALQLDEQDACTVQAAALLHDVGHGPFSHAFEELKLQGGRSHEDISEDLVAWGPLADLVRQGGMEPRAVTDLIMGRGPLAKLVAGPIDADRMDYLLRDAHFTGVPSNVDPDRVLSVIERDDEHGVVLRESGILSAEAMLTTRFLMYPAVYLHHTVRASERMLQASIRAAVAGGLSARGLERETDDGLMHRLRQSDGADMMSRLDRRRLYKRAWECPVRSVEPVRELAGNLLAQEELAEELAAAAGVPNEAVLVDVPKPPKFREAQLHVRMRDGTVRPLPEVSQLVASLQHAGADHWRAWVFAPREHVDSVAKAAAARFA